MSSLLKGKKGLVTGVANDKSIAWGIAKMAHEHGAELAFSYQGEALKKRIDPLAESVSSNIVLECDVRNEDALDKMFVDLESKMGGIDFMIHSIAFSNKDELKGRYLDTTRDNFNSTMDISCFSLLSLLKRAEKLMHNGGSIITLTYYGAEKVIPNYNVMGIAKAALEASVKYLAKDLGEKGIRVNAISSGPIRTLAASGIGDFRSVLSFNEDNAPLKRNVTTDDVAGTALFLLSDLSSGITGENVHVDAGYHVIGMPSKLY